MCHWTFSLPDRLPPCLPPTVQWRGILPMLLTIIPTWIQRRQIQLKIVKIQLRIKLQLQSTATSTAKAKAKANFQGRWGLKITEREVVSLLKHACDVKVNHLQPVKSRDIGAWLSATISCFLASMCNAVAKHIGLQTYELGIHFTFLTFIQTRLGVG